MTAPMLDRRLVLEGFQEVPDGSGGYDRLWQVLGTLWAEITPVSDREAVVGTAPVSVNLLRIVVRSAPHGAVERPRPEQRFRDGARLYRIVSVVEHDRAGRFLRCRAEEEVVT